MTSLKKKEWDKKYSVDIEEIDAYQKKMFELFNALIDLKEDPKNVKECISLISEMNDYSKLYFATEEKILRINQYPDFGAHSKEHRQFTKRFISLRREVSEDMVNLTDEVIEELRTWLADHIMEYDSLYVPFIRITDFIKQSQLKN